MNTSLMPVARQRYFDSNGRPLTGGRVFTYASGTTTPKATFTDSAGTTPHANPIVLDVNGEALIFWSGSYRVNVTSSIGVQIPGYPVDNYISANVAIEQLQQEMDSSFAELRSDYAAPSGSTLIGELSAATGASPTTVHQKFVDLGISMVADFKAVPDAYTTATNNTAAVQAFMNAQEIDTRTGFVPDGAYAVTDIECGNIATTGTRFPGGQGPGIYHLHGTDRERCQFVSLAGTDTVLKRNNLAGVKVSGLGVAARSLANVGMDFSWILTDNPVAPSNQNVFTDISISFAKIIAFIADNVYDTDFSNLRFTGTPIGMSIKGTGGQHNLTTSLMTGQLICSAQNMDIIQCSLFGGVDINGNGPNFISITGTQIFPTPVSASIPSYKWGVALDATDSGTYGATLKLTNCYVFGGEGQHCIQGKFNHGVTAENCEFNYGIGANLFNAIVGNGVAKPQMKLVNCNLPAAGTPLGTNPTAYEWEIINCYVGGAFIRYASNKTEGFWNPIGDGLEITANVVGTWTRNGNMVTVFFDVTIPSNASTNPAVIIGLPFTQNGTSSSCSFGINTYTASRITIDVNNSRITPYFISVTIPTYANFSGVRIKGMATYLCANPMSGV